MKKYHFTFDRIKKNKKIKKILLNKYKNYSPHLSNVIIVLGGDGFMLDTLKKFQKYNKPFYGINSGTFGFLMNKYNNKNLEKIKSQLSSQYRDLIIDYNENLLKFATFRGVMRTL